MTNLVRALITLVAVVGIADPAIATRNTRGRTNGVSRGHRLRCTTQAERPALVRDADTAKLIAPLDRSGDDLGVAELPAGVPQPVFAATARVAAWPKLAALASHTRTPFGRAPPF